MTTDNYDVEAADFNRDLQSVLNKHSQENASGTPDFILANFLQGCLEMYNDAVQQRGSWRDEPAAFKPVVKPDNTELVPKEYPVIEEEPSQFQNVMDALMENQLKAREDIIRKLMENPGFLATYGDDFVAEWGDVEIYTEDDRHTLDRFQIKIQQKVRFFTKEYYESLRRDADKVLREDNLRQRLDGGLESV